MKRRQQFSRPAPVLLLALLAACTAVGHVKTEGWPVLKVTEHRVPNAEMRERCAKYVGVGMSPMACAEFNLAAGTCDIWLSADFPAPAVALEHERMHCAGYDHFGGAAMHRAVDALGKQ